MLDKFIYNFQNVCGCLTLNKIHIELVSLIICSINDNVTKTSLSPSLEVEKKKCITYSKFNNFVYLNRNSHLLKILRTKSLTRFKHQINVTVVLLSCRSFFQNQSICWKNRIFKCNKFAVSLCMIFAVLYKYLNCDVDKTIDSGHATSTDCNTNYRIILLINC